MTGRYCFDRSLSVHRGVVPISHNALQHFPECHGAAGGVPDRVPPGGISVWVPPSVYLTGYTTGGYLNGYPPGGT